MTLNKSSRIQDVNVSLEAAAKSFQSDNNKSLIQYEQNIFLKMNTLTKKNKKTRKNLRSESRARGPLMINSDLNGCPPAHIHLLCIQLVC